METYRGAVCILGAARTPIGAFLGSLSSLTAPQLGAIAIKGALERSGLNAAYVDAVIMGNVLGAGLGQAPERQAALAAGIPTHATTTLVNKVCSSGIKAVTMAVQSILCGDNEVVVAGGMESMSNAPYLVSGKARRGMRFGNTPLVDSMLHDGLLDPFASNAHMGEHAELAAREFCIDRSMQDEHAAESFRRAQAAAKSGAVDWEIVAAEVAAANGKTMRVTEDENIWKMDNEKIKQLRPVFIGENGTVTAANSSSLADGAAALVIASEAKAQELNLPVLAKIIGYADAAQAPQWYTTAPTAAIKKALDRCTLDVDDVDAFEINEAFSVVDIVNRGLLDLDGQLVNRYGGSVALGHPIGASGAKILVTLINVLRQQQGAIGVAATCNGGGGATALVIETKP